jgi:hypothetical protein
MVRQTIGDVETQDDQEPFSPPLTDAQILSLVQQCIDHVLTDPDLGEVRDSYGTPGDRTAILVSQEKPAWPEGLRLEAGGIQLDISPPRDVDPVNEDRRLGIWLSKLDVVAPTLGFFDGNIILTLANAGGGRNGDVIGGCFVFYVIRLRDGAPMAVCVGRQDP